MMLVINCSVGHIHADDALEGAILQRRFFIRYVFGHKSLRSPGSGPFSSLLDLAWPSWHQPRQCQLKATAEAAGRKGEKEKL